MRSALPKEIDTEIRTLYPYKVQFVTDTFNTLEVIKDLSVGIPDTELRLESPG